MLYGLVCGVGRLVYLRHIYFTIANGFVVAVKQQRRASHS